jgi:hypothetical protein
MIRLIGAFSVAVALVALGARSFGIAEGSVSLALIAGFVLGLWLPLFLLIYAVSSRRGAVIAIAFCVGLSVNLVFLTHASPAAAVTDNSSVFTFENSTTFSPPNPNMRQNYTPTSPSATTCPAAGGSNWQCSWTSDTFTSGQTFSAGTSQVDLYASNNNGAIVRKSQGGIQHTSNDCGAGVSRPAVANGDVLLLSCTYRTGATIASAPSGWSLVGAQTDATSAISLVTYAHVITDASSEPTTNSFPLTPTTSVKMLAYYMNYSGVDNANITDGVATQSTPSATSHTALGVTTTVANDVLLTLHTTANCVTWTSPAGMTEVLDSTGCTNSASSNVDMEINQLALGAAGGTGNKIATNDGAAVGVTMTIALRVSTATLTCTLTAQLSKPIRYRSSDSNGANSATSITVNKPAGVVDGDVLVGSVSFSTAITFTSAPAGWTQVRISTNGGVGVGVWVKVASGEPASYTWNTSAASSMAAGISAYIGVDNTTPVDAENGGMLANGTSVTTVTPATMLVVSSMKGNNGVSVTFTPPAGMNERVDRVSTAATFTAIEQADALWAPAAASGIRLAVPSDAPNPIAAITVALRPASALIGSTTLNIVSPATTSLFSASFATSGVTFATGDQLQLDVYAPNDPINCYSSVSYDSTSTPSKLTVAMAVPDGAAGLLLLAPPLPVAARWWKRRRP